MSENSWKQALGFTLAYEGGYVNDPRDRGGETFRGISRNAWPEWLGWAEIDAIRFGSENEHAFGDALMADPKLLQSVKHFYRENFWDPIHGDELPGKVAAAVFDAAVHSGVRTACRLLQGAVGVNVDGVIGSKTIKAVHDAGENGLIDFLAARTRYLCDIMIKDPGQTVWARNWFRRLFRLGNIVLEGDGIEFGDA